MSSRSSVPLAVLLLGLALGVMSGASCATSGGDGAASLAGGDDASPGSGHDAGASACSTDLSSDPHHCGSCDNACSAGQQCVSGACASACAAPLMTCPPAGCIDVSADLKNCGACGVVCAAAAGGTGTPACTAGQCTFNCPSTAGVQACPNGCFDLRTSTDNCGSCSTTCAPGQTCANGVCCGGATQMCGGSCIDVTQDSTNCGACGHKCATGASCAAGVCSGYAATASTTPFVDACSLTGHQVLLPGATGWEESAAVALPFDFAFFGAKQTQFWLGSQGTLGLGSAPAASGYPSCPLPDSLNAYSAVVAFGDALDTQAEGICHATTGTAPNRQLVVTWEKVTHESDPGSVLTFSVLLGESTGTIDVVYQTATPGTGGGGYVRGSAATVGLQGPAGGFASQYACGQGSNDLYNATPFAVRFTPL